MFPFFYLFNKEKTGLNGKLLLLIVLVCREIETFISVRQSIKVGNKQPILVEYN